MRTSKSILAASQAISELGGGRKLVAIDGRDGAGKTTFADLLAQAVERPTVRASVDNFHNPRAKRYAKGRQSPEGFYRDSFDYETLARLLLRPFKAGDRFKRQAFDHLTDTAVDAPWETAADDAVLILDGLFLHRQELQDWWDLSVLLDVAPDITAKRMLERDGQEPTSRYIVGQVIYFAEADPESHATLVLPW